MLALRKALDGVRRGQTAALDRALDRAQTEPDAAQQDPPADDADLIGTGAPSARSDRDTEFLHSLERIADSIERVATQLDSYHRERAEHLDAIEFLLREMVIGTVPPSTNRPGVLGGVIDNGEREISLVVDESPLGIDAAVEVRSRFHDRWIGGYTIAEIVSAPGRRRFRLTRRSDGIPLPILFDACDVRAAEDAFSRQHAPS
jgi:hypothetical protein